MLICLHALPSSIPIFRPCPPVAGRVWAGSSLLCAEWGPGGRIFRSFVCFYGLKVWTPYRVPPRFTRAGGQKYGAVYVKTVYSRRFGYRLIKICQIIGVTTA